MGLGLPDLFFKIRTTQAFLQSSEWSKQSSGAERFRLGYFA